MCIYDVLKFSNLSMWHVVMYRNAWRPGVSISARRTAEKD